MSPLLNPLINIVTKKDLFTHQSLFGAVSWEDNFGCATYKLILDLDRHQKYFQPNKRADILEKFRILI